MLSRRAALLAAFLLAINPLHVYYSQEVRMYGLVALLSIGVLATAWALMERIGEHLHPPTGVVSANRPNSPCHLMTLT